MTANRFSESADDLPYGVSVIGSDAIARSGAATISEAITKILGIPGQLDLTGGNNNSLDLRGFGATSAQNQVVIVDGRRFNEQDSATAALSSIAIETVEKIEVIRGNAAVAYGEGATGGAIVVTTKAGMGVERHNAAQLTGTLGNFGLRELRSSAVLTSGAISVDVSASDRSSDGHRENFASDSNSLSSTVQWSNDWLRAGVQSGRNMLHSGTPGGLSQAQYDSNAYQANASYSTAFNQIKNENSGVFLEAAVGNWQFGADYGERTKNYDSEIPAYASSSLYDVKASSTNLRARNENTLGNYKNALVLGLDSDVWSRNASWSGPSSATTNGVYVTDDLSLLSTGTRFAVGLRTESLNKSDTASGAQLSDAQNAWNLGVTQSVGGGAHVYARTGESFRMGNVDEFSFVSAGTQLKTQTSRDTEVGARLVGAAGRAELRWYRSELQNEIAYDPAAAPPYGSYPGANVNLDPTVHQGVELELQRAVAADLTLRANAALRQSRFSAGLYAGNDIALVPNQTLAVGAAWTPTVEQTLDLGVNWVASQKVDFANQCSVPAYSTVDVHYAYAMRNTEVSLGVTNLADTKFYTFAADCIGSVPDGIYLEPGRAVMATVRLKF